MRKRTLAAPPENGAISAYTSELSRLLRPGVPGERADEIIREAEAHLYDQTDTLIQTENLPRPLAEARAVSEFTPAVTFAQEMGQSVYETRQSQVWRRISSALPASLFTLLLGFLMFDGFYHRLTDLFFSLLLLLVIVCAYQARRAQTRKFVAWGVFATLFTLFNTGFFYFPKVPTQSDLAHIERAYRYWHHDQVRREIESHSLRLGLQTDQKPYIVPAPYHVLGDSHPFPMGTPETVSTLAEARDRWQADGPRWLARVQQILNRDKRYAESFRLAGQEASSAQMGDLRGRWYVLVVGEFSLCLVLFDRMFSYLGRVAFTRRRKRVTKRAKQA